MQALWKAVHFKHRAYHPQYLEWVRPKLMTLYVKLIPKQIVKTVVFCCKPNVKGVIILFVGKMPDLSLCPLIQINHPRRSRVYDLSHNGTLSKSS